MTLNLTQFCVIEQYYSLKKQLGNNAKSSSEIDFEVIREQIRENYCKKTWTTCKHDEVRFEFERRSNGFSLFIS